MINLSVENPLNDLLVKEPEARVVIVDVQFLCYQHRMWIPGTRIVVPWTSYLAVQKESVVSPKVPFLNIPTLRRIVEHDDIRILEPVMVRSTRIELLVAFTRNIETHVLSRILGPMNLNHLPATLTFGHTLSSIEEGVAGTSRSRVVDSASGILTRSRFHLVTIISVERTELVNEHSPISSTSSNFSRSTLTDYRTAHLGIEDHHFIVLVCRTHPARQHVGHGSYLVEQSILVTGLVNQMPDSTHGTKFLMWFEQPLMTEATHTHATRTLIPRLLYQQVVIAQGLKDLVDDFILNVIGDER